MSLTKVSYSMIQGAAISVLDFGASPTATAATNNVAIQAAIDYAQSSQLTPKIIDFGTGIYKVSTVIDIHGYFSPQGLMLRGNNAVIQSDTAYGGAQFNVVADGTVVPPLAHSNVRFQGLNFVGPGKTVAGSRSIVISATVTVDVTASVWVSDCIVDGFAGGLVSNRGIDLNFDNVVFQNNGIGYSSPDLSNQQIFNSCRFLANNKAVYMNGFGLGAVSFNNCLFELNSLGGTSTDGVKCLEFTNAGHLTFNSCHFESNDCQYGVHFSGTTSDSSITFNGCEVLAGLGSQVWANSALVTSIGSYISSGVSVNDLYLDANCNVTLINSFTTLQGPGATSVVVLGGYSNATAVGNNSLKFLNRTAALDDYEATTWADASLSLVNCSSATLSNATYTKVGRQVTVYGRISATLTTTATAVNVVFNLPISTTANTCVAVGNVVHTLTTNGIGFVNDTTTGDPSQATLTAPANQVTVANGSAFVADFTFTYET